MILCVKTGQKEVLRVIRELGEFSIRPEGMAVDSDEKIYYKQYDIDYEVKGTGKSTKRADRLKLNLYFDAMRRTQELVELEICLNLQEEALTELLENQSVLDDNTTIKRDYCYYKITYDPATRVITSFERNEKKVAKASMLSGFFAIMTHGVDFDAMKTFQTYQLRDEQEKYFGQMKSQMGADRQRNWSEEGKSGRDFIIFIALTLSSYVRHIWKSTRLYDLFSSSLEILDEMRPIRAIEHTNRAKVITPFVGAQVDICEVFGFKIPDGCSPGYVSRKKEKRKAGRPPKNHQR